MTKPLVAIVGRPNVGKSTLFNRLTGERRAIVTEVPGTTRDRVTAEARWGDRTFILADTGGLELGADDDILRQVRRQAEAALSEADVIVMVTEAVQGVTEADREVADLLRRRGRPVVLAVNKADNEARRQDAVEFYQLGLGDPVPISAYHNVGIEELMARVLALMPPEVPEAEVEADFHLAIVGRTNVGKSMLVNAISGQERAIVSDVPGTTRDSLDTLVRYDGASVLLIDTAGIRRRGRVAPGIERYSVLRAVRAIDRAHVVALIMDASELATNQDTHIAGYILEAYKGVVLVVNKWDLAPHLGMGREDALRVVRERFNFASYAPVCFVSALRGEGISDLLATARQVYEEWTKTVPRYGLRRVVMTAVAEHPPPSVGRRSLRIYSVAQEGAGPPTFTFYVNYASMVHFSYQRYLENRIRKAYGFVGSPLRLRFRGWRKEG